MKKWGLKGLKKTLNKTFQSPMPPNWENLKGFAISESSDLKVCMMIEIKNTLAVTALAAVIFCAPLASASDKTRAKPGHKHDIFSQIVGDQTGLKKVYDNGDDCQFIITNDAAREALYTTLTDLAKAKPSQRDSTLAWDIANTRAGQTQAQGQGQGQAQGRAQGQAPAQGQAKMIAVTITKNAQGQSVLTLDRRLGERGSNPNAQDRRRAAANTETARRTLPTPHGASGQMSPLGKVVPPPATVD